MKRTRNIQLKLYVSEEEKGLITDNMKRAKMNYLSHYLRKVSIDTLFINVDYSEIKNLSYEVSKIGNNINQIAKRVNTTGNIYENDLKGLKGYLEKIWLEIRGLYVR